MARSKTIKLFWIDGEASGRVKCSLANWIGVAYRVPRTKIGECKSIEYLKQSGVYFLFGTDSQYNQIVYIGQANARKNGEGLLFRVQEPHESIDWTEAVMITATNNSLGSTEISYLENRFCNMAIAAGRYQVCNGNEPNTGNFTEETQSEMEEFIEYTKIVMGALGHRVLEPLVSHAAEKGDDDELLYMDYKKAHATGKRTDKGFVVLKGSTIDPDITKTCPMNAKKARNEYADKINDEHTLTEDISLPSPSAAAGFVGGASLSGNEQWHNAKGILLKYIE